MLLMLIVFIVIGLLVGLMIRIWGLQQQWLLSRDFLSEVSHALEKNIPLEEVFEGLEIQYRGTSNYHLRQMATTFRNSGSLAEVMKENSHLFSRELQSSIQFAEKEGLLEEIAPKLKDQQDLHLAEMRILYVIFLYPLAMGILLLFYFTTVVPKLQKIFLALSVETHEIFHLLSTYGPLGIVLFLGLLFFYIITREIQMKSVTIAYYLPGLRRTAYGDAVSQYASVMGILMENKTPLHKAHKTAVESLDSGPLRKSLESITPHLEEGASLGEELDKLPIHGEVQARLVTAVETSSPGKALSRLSEKLKEEVGKRRLTIARLFYPLSVIFFASLIGLVFYLFFNYVGIVRSAVM